ncbi:MAG TPA: SHOCT domain-containing protein [archaeon]|nr:SHOCT domain-containing protein [archaeon]
MAYEIGAILVLGGLLLFIIIIFVVLALLIRLIFWGVQHDHHKSLWRHHSEAFEILRSRYAKGEITKEQYLEMMKNLEES